MIYFVVIYLWHYSHKMYMITNIYIYIYIYMYIYILGECTYVCVCVCLYTCISRYVIS